MQFGSARRPSSIPPRLSAEPIPQSHRHARPSSAPPRATRTSPERAETPYASVQRASPQPSSRSRSRVASAATAQRWVRSTCSNLSTTGFAARVSEELAFAPGSALESLELLLDGRPIWSGDAVIVHENTERNRARFVSGVVDLRHVMVGATVDGRLALLAAQRAKLPPEWRAGRVGSGSAPRKRAAGGATSSSASVPDDPLHRTEEEAELFPGSARGWGAVYYDAVAALHARSKSLDESVIQLARGYASSALMPILAMSDPPPRLRKAPRIRGRLSHDGAVFRARARRRRALFGRFLHSISQGYSLGRDSRRSGRADARGRARRRWRPGDGARPRLSVAAGPAIELRKLLRESASLRRPLQLMLLDQDEGALEIAHRRTPAPSSWRGARRAPGDGRSVCHFSVRQLLQPRTLEEAAVFEKTLAGLDLIYRPASTITLPEPVAKRLTRLLYSRTAPGGACSSGISTETPESTWMIEYVLGWHLLYRHAGGDAPARGGSLRIQRASVVRGHDGALALPRRGHRRVA